MASFAATRRPLVRPTYKDGYARSAAESTHPELWNGLVGAWAPNLGVSGLTLHDVSGFNNHGALTNMVTSAPWMISDGHLALDFDGENDHIDCGDVLNIGTGDATLSAWVIVDGYDGETSKGIITKSRNTGGVDGYGILTQTGGKFRAVFREVGNTYITPDAGISIDDGEFHHVLATFDRNGNATTYVDGVLDQVIDISPEVGVDISNSDNLVLAAYRNSSGAVYREFNGLVDDCLIYDRILSLPLIKEIYQTGRGSIFQKRARAIPIINIPRQRKLVKTVKGPIRVQPTYKDGYARNAAESAHPELWRGLVGAWAPNLGVSGQTLRDISGFNNHGVLTNMDADDWVISDGHLALDFDEVDDHILIPDFSYGPNFTISFWFKVRDLSGSDFQYMFSHGAFDVANSVNIFHYEDSRIGHPDLRTVLRDSDDSSVAEALDIFVNYEDGDWHLYSLTVGSFGSRVYIDGIQEASSSQGGDSFNPTTGIYWGGREDTDPDRFFDGLLDDLIIHNKTLSASLIKDLYQAGCGGIYQKRSKTIVYFPTTPISSIRNTVQVKSLVKPSYKDGYARSATESAHPELWRGLIGAWAPNLGVSGQTLRDISGFNNHGALTNMDADDWVLSEGHQALDYTSSGARVEITSTFFDIGNEPQLSLVTWARNDNGPGENEDKLFEHRSGSGIYVRARKGAFIDEIEFVIKADLAEFSFTSISSIVDAGWTMLTYVRRSNTSHEIWFNDVLEATDTTDAGSGSGNDKLRIGTWEPASAGWVGLIDDHLAYDRAIAPEEIQQLYDLGRGGLFQKRSKSISWFLPAGYRKNKLFTEPSLTLYPGPRYTFVDKDIAADGSQTITPTGIISAEVIGAHQLNMFLHPTGLTTAEVIGAHQVNMFLHPTGLTTAEVIGAHQLNIFVHPTGLTSDEIIGAHTLLPGEISITPTGIASAETIGSHSLVYIITPTGITSNEVIGAHQLNLFVHPTGLTSDEAIGVHFISNLIVNPTGITSAEIIGAHTLLPGEISITPTGIASAETIGSHSLVYVITPTGITSNEVIGAHQLDMFVHPAGLISAEVIGGHAILLVGSIEPTGIASAEIIGGHQLNMFLQGFTGIASAETIGSHQLNFVLSPTGVASAEVVGAHTLLPGEVTITPAGILSAEAIGSHQLNMFVHPAGLLSAEVIGTHQLNMFLHPTGILSAEVAGTHQLNMFLNPAGIISAEVIVGHVILPGGITISPTGIISAEVIGGHVIFNFDQFIQAVGVPTAMQVGKAILRAIPLDSKGHFDELFRQHFGNQWG